MRLVPRKKWPQISFYLTHVPKWMENVAPLGLDPAKVASLQARAEAAYEALKAQRAAQSTARAKTMALHNALEAMNSEGAGIIKQIRGQAATLGNQAYTLALISAPDKASPIAAPGAPYGFTSELTQIGTLILRWKCKNPRGARGTLYQVHRQIMNQAGEQGPLEFLGIAGRKKFEDAKLPPGVREIIYHVQAFRSMRFGLVVQHPLSFASPRGLPLPGRMQLAGKMRLSLPIAA